jgi:predicted ribosomally synthesized peptide with SipW-like signal peptide
MFDWNSFRRLPLTRLMLVSAVATGVLATAAGHGTMAYFTSTVVSDQNAFTAGNLQLNIADNNSNSATTDHTNPSKTVDTSITLSNMKPGDVVFAPIHVSNVGSIDARLGIAYSTAKSTGATDDIAKALTIELVGRGSGTGTMATCNSTTIDDGTHWLDRVIDAPAGMFATQGTIVSSGWTTPSTAGQYASGDSAAHKYLKMPGGENIDGSASNSAEADDIFCVRVEMPSTVDNTWNGTSPDSYDTTVTFTFDAAQLVQSAETDI